MDSAGVWLVRWIPPEFGYSSGFRRSPVDLLSGKSLDGFHGLRWNMLVSGGIRRTPPGIIMPIWPLSHQDIPGFESGGFQWNPLDSGSFRRRRWGSVQSSDGIATPGQSSSRKQHVPKRQYQIYQISQGLPHYRRRNTLLELLSPFHSYRWMYVFCKLG